jgi:phenylalanine-4-hydroxylase
MLPEDHPGFSDALYRRRREEIASIANSYKFGDVVLDVPYIREEHIIWESINIQLEALYGKYACAEYRECYTQAGLDRVTIPQFATINKILRVCDFSVSPVAGLVSPREFLSTLADNTMLCTQYIRHYSIPEYTPEPDVVHELLGHCIFFLNKDLVEINRLFGRVARVVTDDGIEKLIRLYWHTVEFGACMENDGGPRIKAYGAGLLSSIKELSSMDDIPTREFNIEDMENTSYDTMNPQPFIFCAKSFSHVIEDLTEHLHDLL